ncbi:hypothetical protein Phou_060040 [Phytohabitans houttuyneae]|uniref:Uncharacterized protein n=1 Tax=Phytohabitans houttuyneae TaxID=1076126 RepID=A0A6V8KDF3_9ACTN|nr:hypothetical protein Phou_060040 [Phytohabitans houttuyneae]
MAGAAAGLVRVGDRVAQRGELGVHALPPPVGAGPFEQLERLRELRARRGGAAMATQPLAVRQPGARHVVRRASVDLQRRLEALSGLGVVRQQRLTAQQERAAHRARGVLGPLGQRRQVRARAVGVAGAHRGFDVVGDRAARHVPAGRALADLFQPVQRGARVAGSEVQQRERPRRLCRCHAVVSRVGQHPLGLLPAGGAVATDRGEPGGDGAEHHDLHA